MAQQLLHGIKVGRTLPIRLPPPAPGEHNGEILDPLRARDCSHTRSE
jgi:hypothetical protein